VLDRIREILKVDETASPKPRHPVNGVVLDASAVLAVAFNEAGSATVMKHRANAFISTANINFPTPIPPASHSPNFKESASSPETATGQLFHWKWAFN
jgi:hypothetical protein